MHSRTGLFRAAALKRNITKLLIGGFVLMATNTVRFIFIPLLAGALALLGQIPDADAATFTVNSTNDGQDQNLTDGQCHSFFDFCTLRAAIQQANQSAGPDIITLPVGTYTLNVANTAGAHENNAAAGDLDIIGDLTITGAGAASTTIDGGLIDRVFHIRSGNVTITGVTIQNGKTAHDTLDVDISRGGGILNDASLTLNNCEAKGNTAFAESGGGIYNTGTMTLINTGVSGNTAVEFGGGIFNQSAAALTLNNSTISGNSAKSGGGIGSQASLTITNSTVSSNNAGVNGGGIETFGSMPVTIMGSTISGNTAGESGGGISSGGNLTVKDSTISGNTATSFDGGGISNISGTLTLTNSTISNNTAGAKGGGIANQNESGVASLTADSATISHNSGGIGGGLFNESGASLTLKNTIISNSGAGGNCSGSVTSAGHNLDSGNSCGLTGTGDRVNADPMLGPLQNNGGSTFTRALQAGSPAIDAGDPSACLPADQRGQARYGPCDIGAFEFAGSCGDGVHQPLAGEPCDDGNLASGDGCSSTCQTELVAGPSAPSVPSEPAAPAAPSAPTTGETGGELSPAPAGTTVVPIEAPPSQPAEKSSGGGCSLINVASFHYEP